MRTYVSHQEARDAFEFAELAYGFDNPEPDFPSLFRGVPGESAEERAARLDVARQVLVELLAEAGDDPDDEVAWLNALHAAQLMDVVPLRLRGSGGRAKPTLRKAA
ncbi:hypothetical protein [Streptomyces sp. CC228A]|uniref:hypothetical protein n=1 Tax=Streptomyces sp. CC228A TaxID=2898186 RepID=UPI001F3BC6C8|nr:hypothetical protein [Streptomyces sp. CC228A]